MLPYEKKELSPKERAKDLLLRMNLKEKIGQLNQRLYGFRMYERNGEEIVLCDELKEEVERYGGLGVLYGLYRADPWSGRNYTNGLYGRYVKEAYNKVQNYVMEHSRFHIPMLLSSECPHGHQALDGYLLPVNLSVGATFHPELYEEACNICGMELKQMGVDLALVSMLDILRDPRWGRSEECYGEDPYLAAVFAKAAVRGIQNQGVAVVAKHFCAQGEGTGGVNASAARIGERELREIHLPAAAACCEEGVIGIMAAYNEIDGIPCHANRWLLTTLLREELNFGGVVMSDGVAIDELDRMTGDNVVSASKALHAGVDIGLWDNAYGKLEEALNVGLIDIEEIDQAVLRVLTLKFRQGLFEHSFIDQEVKVFDGKNYPHALELARESFVLLKNESVLPLNHSVRSISLFGNNADDFYSLLGDYTSPVREERQQTIRTGMEHYIKEHQPTTKLFYTKGCERMMTTKEMLLDACNIAKQSEVCVVVLGGSSDRFTKPAQFDTNGALLYSDWNMDCGEGVDTSRLELPEAQLCLLRELKKTGLPIITVIIGGRPYAIEEAAELSDAVIYGFYPGTKTAQALSEILFGRISPSGRLPVSIPRSTGQIPVYYNYKSSYQAMNYYNQKNSALYTFGYGLSYSAFRYDNIRFLCDYEPDIRKVTEEGIGITFDIINTGDYDTYAVPQLYLHILKSSTTRRVRELKAFQKVWVPKEGRKNVVLRLKKAELSVWDDKMQFRMEPGSYEFILADEGKDIWSDTLKI